jgi:hypothetical protein
MREIDRVGKERGWLCFYCHTKVSPTLPPGHNFAPVIILHPKGDKTIAHTKCDKAAKAGKIGKDPGTRVTSSEFKEAIRNVRDVASVRMELSMTGELLDMAKVPPGTTVMDRISGVLADYVEMRGQVADLTEKLATADDLKSKSVADKAAKLEAELEEVKGKVADLQAERARIQKQVAANEILGREGEAASQKLVALTLALKAVLDSPVPEKKS